MSGEPEPQPPDSLAVAYTTGPSGVWEPLEGHCEGGCQAYWFDDGSVGALCSEEKFVQPDEKRRPVSCAADMPCGHCSDRCDKNGRCPNGCM